VIVFSVTTKHTQTQLAGFIVGRLLEIN